MKISQSEFVKTLIRKSSCETDEEFGRLFGVTKSSVSHWKNEKAAIPLERFLEVFGKETLDWIKQYYNLEDESAADAKRHQRIGRLMEEVVRLSRKTNGTCCDEEDLLEVIKEIDGDGKGRQHLLVDPMDADALLDISEERIDGKTKTTSPFVIRTVGPVTIGGLSVDGVPQNKGKKEKGNGHATTL